ncbi:MAG: MarR family winged helix-turn-helix transcriptional regulator [Acidobacteriota bacterium]|nr:MarR family winged helix-turn-helix transcriptional regulator [Acidobacteriota bacterium]
MTLRYAGPSSQNRMAALLEMDQTTLSRNLSLLERERWIVVTRDGADARRRLYQVTPLGTSVLAEAQRCWRQVHKEMERLLGESMAGLWPALDRILEAAAADDSRNTPERTGQV